MCRQYNSINSVWHLLSVPATPWPVPRVPPGLAAHFPPQPDPRHPHGGLEAEQIQYPQSGV